MNMCIFVDLLEDLNTPAYKIDASIYLPLIKYAS